MKFLYVRRFNCFIKLLTRGEGGPLSDAGFVTSPAQGADIESQVHSALELTLGLPATSATVSTLVEFGEERL